MPWNGSGTFFRDNGVNTGPNVWDQDASTVETILSDRHDTHDEDLATGINNTLTKDGQSWPPTANLNMGGRKFLDIANGTARNQALAVGQSQDNSATWCGTAGGTADALTLTPSPPFTAYTAGQEVSFIAAFNNTGATTINISGLGNRAVKTLNGADLLANYFVAGRVYRAIDSGTELILITQPDVLSAEGDLIVQGTSNRLNLPRGGDNQNLSVKGTSLAYTGGIEKKTANYTVAKADHRKTLLGDAQGGAITITLPDVTTVGSGFRVKTQKLDSSANFVTIATTGGDTINGLSSFDIRTQFETYEIEGDGSEWYFVGSGGDSESVLVNLATASNSATVELTDLAGYHSFQVFASNIRPATDNVYMRCRLSDNNGSTFYSGASDYRGDSSDQAYLDIVPASVDGSSNAANEFINFEANFHLPDVLAYTYMRAWYGQVRFSGNVQSRITYQYLKKSVAVNAVQFYMSSGNIAEGEFRVYGKP